MMNDEGGIHHLSFYIPLWRISNGALGQRALPSRAHVSSQTEGLIHPRVSAFCLHPSSFPSEFHLLPFCEICAICGDRKSTRLNSSHLGISYAVFCLKKKKKQMT